MKSSYLTPEYLMVTSFCRKDNSVQDLSWQLVAQRFSNFGFPEIVPAPDVGQDFCPVRRDHFQFLLTAVVLAGTLHILSGK